MISSIKHFDELSKMDVYEILQLRTEVFIVEQTCPYQDCDGKDLDAYHLMVHDEVLVAYLRILKPGISYEETSIGRVVVKASHRQHKLGKKIMVAAIDFIRENNLLPVRISAQAYLKAFYESLGFKQVSQIYLEDDIPHMEMFMEC